MTFAFTKYWVEGEKEVLQTLFEAITNNEDCYAEDVLLNLGINTDDYDTSRVEWCNAELIQKDGATVLYFEEYYPYERGEILDKLFEEKQFAGKLTHMYYYAEEGANADLYETNDEDRKYWPNRMNVNALFPGKNQYAFLYFRDAEDAVKQILQSYDIPAECDSLDKIKEYVDGQSNEGEVFWYNEIEVVTYPFVNWK